jgi:hypothetical protein
MSRRRSVVSLLVACLAPLAALATEDPVERWASAVGGRERVASVAVIYREATVQIGPYEGWIKIWHRADGSYRKEESIGPYSAVEIFDGSTGTVQVGTEPARRFTEPELAVVRSKAYANWNAVFFALFPERRRGELVVETDGTIVLLPAGGVPWRVTLDPATALPSKMVHDEGEQTITVSYAAYESIDGLQLEREIHRSNGDPRFDAVIRFTKTVLNPTVDAALLAVDPASGSAAAASTSP